MQRFTTTILLILCATVSCTTKRASKEGNNLVSAADSGTTPSFGHEPPANPYLADSPWPMTHRHPYAQASSPYIGPTSESDFSPRINDDVPPVSVTLSISSRYKSGKHAIWGYVTGEVVVVDSSNWKLANRLRVTPKNNDDEKSSLSGAYHLIDKDNKFFVPYGQKLGKFSDPKENFKILKEGEFTLPKAAKGEQIVGINLAFDGHIIFVTNMGRLGYLDRDFSKYKEIFIEQHKADISNSIATDEDGGIFVLTSKAIHKIQAESNSTISHQWQVPYSSSSQAISGRLGSGSGTTPTLMGFGDNNDKFVVFADGQDLMNLILVWRDKIPNNWKAIGKNPRRIAAIEPITFIPHNKRKNINLKKMNSVTEQSVLVRGYEAVVVSNKYGDPNPVMKKVVKFISERMGRNLSPSGLVVALSNHEAVSPKGIEKFSWDSKDQKLSSLWANDKISCPNGIPSMSEPTGLMYCVGADGPSNFFWGSSWTFEGISWHTGKRVFSYPLGNKFFYNSFYAGTQIGLDGGLLTGVVGGVLSSN